MPPLGGPWQLCEHAHDRKLVRRQVFIHDVAEVKHEVHVPGAGIE